MATPLTVTTTAAAGVLAPAAAAADGSVGNSFTNTGREWIEIINGAVAPITATFVTTGTYNVGAVPYAIADVAVTVANGTSKLVGPFDTGLFGTVVTVTFSSVTTITLRTFSLGVA